jgi:SAM-dependent methyltransferase
VLDLCCGTASASVAAVLEGRSVFALDADDRQFSAAVNRLKRVFTTKIDIPDPKRRIAITKALDDLSFNFTALDEATAGVWSFLNPLHPVIPEGVANKERCLAALKRLLLNHPSFPNFRNAVDWTKSGRHF